MSTTKNYAWKPGEGLVEIQKPTTAKRQAPAKRPQQSPQSAKGSPHKAKSGKTTGKKAVKAGSETRGETQEPEEKNKTNLESPARSTNCLTRARTGWRDRFLKAFARTGIIIAACREVSVSREAVTYARKSSPKFEAAFQKAMTDANEILEMHALRIATMGQDDPIFARDKHGNPVKVYDRRRVSEKILELLLRSRMPAKYSPKFQTEISGPNGQAFPLVSPAQVTIIIPDNGRDRPITEIHATPTPQPAIAPPPPIPDAEPTFEHSQETEGAITESEAERKWRLESERIDRANNSARDRIDSQGRKNESHRGSGGNTF